MLNLGVYYLSDLNRYKSLVAEAKSFLSETQTWLLPTGWTLFFLFRRLRLFIKIFVRIRIFIKWNRCSENYMSVCVCVTCIRPHRLPFLTKNLKISPFELKMAKLLHCSQIGLVLRAWLATTRDAILRNSNKCYYSLSSTLFICLPTRLTCLPAYLPTCSPGGWLAYLPGQLIIFEANWSAHSHTWLNFLLLPLFSGARRSNRPKSATTS